MKKILSLLLVFSLFITLSACGTENIICPTCSQKLSGNVKFCTNCGSALNEHTENNSKFDFEQDVGNTQENTESQNPATSSTVSTSHTHTYSKRVTSATCTEKGYTIYTCPCGDTYKSDYIEPSHNYQKNVCTKCGAKHENYNLYQTEYNKITADHDSKISELQSKIAESNKKIETYQKAINNARGSLNSLSSTCPQSYIQRYINNWQAYGSTAAATQAAKSAWTQEYNNQRTQLNNTITTNTSKIQTEQTNINLYNSTISSLTTQYNNDVNILKTKYGMN